MILVDTGPLVALIHRDDVHHRSCRTALESLSGPLWSVGPVIVEAMYLLNFSWSAQDALWEMLESGLLKLFVWDEQDFSRMRELMKKYSDLPMDFADAALVCIAERERIKQIFTTDRRDFGLYRPKHVKRLHIIPQELGSRGR